MLLSSSPNITNCPAQLNRFLEEGSVQLLPTDQSYQVGLHAPDFENLHVAKIVIVGVVVLDVIQNQVNFKKLMTSVTNLVRDICTWQHNGDKNVVDAVFEK